MKLSELIFLSDENIQPEVVHYIRSLGYQILDVKENNLQGSSDLDLLQLAFEESRVIITHDSDFGKLAIRGGYPIKGIIYLRPGHINTASTIASWKALNSSEINFSIPFILVAENQGEVVKVRLRNL